MGLVSRGLRTTRSERMVCSACAGAPAALRTLAVGAARCLHPNPYRRGRATGQHTRHRPPPCLVSVLGMEPKRAERDGKSQGQTLMFNVFQMTYWTKVFLKSLTSVFLVLSGAFEGFPD